MELVKYSGFVYEILTLLAWLTHTGSKKSYLSKRPAKMAQQGLVCEQGSVSPYSGGENRTQTHTGGHAGGLFVKKSACSKKTGAVSTFR